jgi:hypothetical protein
MKIQQIKVNFVRLPLEEPLVGAPYMPGMLREFFTVQVQTDDGIERHRRHRVRRQAGARTEGGDRGFWRADPG